MCGGKNIDEFCVAQKLTLSLAEQRLSEAFYSAVIGWVWAAEEAWAGEAPARRSDVRLSHGDGRVVLVWIFRQNTTHTKHRAGLLFVTNEVFSKYT